MRPANPITLLAPGYVGLSKAEKTRLLNRLLKEFPFNRSYAARRLRAASLEIVPASGRKRYGEELLGVLRLVWASLGWPSGKLLAPFMTEAILALERCGVLRLDDKMTRTLTALSPATISRLLGGEAPKEALLIRRAVALLRLSISDAPHCSPDGPGWVRIGLLQTRPPAGLLVLEDVWSGWVRLEVVEDGAPEASSWLGPVLKRGLLALPFSVRQILAAGTLGAAAEEALRVARARGVALREWVGVRSRRPPSLELAGELASFALALEKFVNFFHPVLKGPGRASTPYARLISWGKSHRSEALLAEYLSINPRELVELLVRLLQARGESA